MGCERYPENLSPFRSQRRERHPRFAELREDFLLDYGFNTARAYWADLEDLNVWALRRDKDVLSLTGEDIRGYLALLRRWRYSPSTIRRRLTTFRAFYAHLITVGEADSSPVEDLRMPTQLRADQGDR